MSLPLLDLARAGETAFVLLSNKNSSFGVQAEATSHEVPVRASTLIPAQAPAEGEQYRFHFDMTKCIGCQCCVVACNEQNGNPSDIHWRRVGEIEGGSYPKLGDPTFRWAVITAWNLLVWKAARRSLYKGSRNGLGAAQCGCLYWLPVLHVELFLRCSPIQC